MYKAKNCPDCKRFLTKSLICNSCGKRWNLSEQPSGARIWNEISPKEWKEDEY